MKSPEKGWANSFLFPKVEAIAAAFESDRHLMGANLWASIKMMVPSVRIFLAFALAPGTIMGMNRKVREAVQCAPAFP